MSTNAKCDHCGTGYERRSTRAKYCSPACRKAAFRVRTYERKGYPSKRPDLHKKHTFDSFGSASMRVTASVTALGTAARELEAATAYLDAIATELIEGESLRGRNSIESATQNLERVRDNLDALNAAYERLERWDRRIATNRASGRY